MSEVSAPISAPARLAEYCGERFPLGTLVTVGALNILSAACVAAAALGRPARLDLGLGLLLASYLLLAFLLRVMDEHKDHARDLEAYPERALSRGVVTLAFLRRAAGLGTLLAAGAALALGVPALVGFLACLGYALLMAREFFLGALLRRDVFACALAHQPLNPLLSAWLVTAIATRWGVAPRDLLGAPLAPLGLYLGTVALLVFAFEVARKLWTPDEERPGLVDSYSSHPIGPRGAGAVALALMLAACGLAAALAVRLGLPAWTHAPFVLCALLCLVTLGKFTRRPYAGAGKALQAGAGLGGLLVHLGLIAGVAARSGLQVAVWTS